MTITRKNALFAGSHGGGRTWATIATRVAALCELGRKTFRAFIVPWSAEERYQISVELAYRARLVAEECRRDADWQTVFSADYSNTSGGNRAESAADTQTSAEFRRHFHDLWLAWRSKLSTERGEWGAPSRR